VATTVVNQRQELKINIVKGMDWQLQIQTK